jgi:hypothetical protein
MGPIPGALSPVVKQPGREAVHSPPPTAEVKNGGAMWRGAKLIKHRNNFTILLYDLFFTKHRAEKSAVQVYISPFQFDTIYRRTREASRSTTHEH